MWTQCGRRVDTLWTLCLSTRLLLVVPYAYHGANNVTFALTTNEQLTQKQLMQAHSWFVLATKQALSTCTKLFVHHLPKHSGGSATTPTWLEEAQPISIPEIVVRMEILIKFYGQKQTKQESIFGTSLRISSAVSIPKLTDSKLDMSREIEQVVQ